jgi:abortive infection bacteriophage resistance protein
MKEQRTSQTISSIVSPKMPTTYAQQVSLIEEKGFIIDDRLSAISFLKQANYYRLSAYFLPFKKSNGTYFNEINFSRIQRIYEFDSHIRALVSRTIEQIELYIRSQFSYHLAHNYGALGYMNDSIYTERHNSTVFKSKIETCIEENKRTPVVRHHQKKYNGQFPIWVIIEFFSMGMLSYMYADMKSADKKTIAHDCFQTSTNCLESWLRCLTDLRNRCAHYSRLYYWSFPAIPKMPKDCNHTADRRLFSQLLMLKYLYPDKQRWNSNVFIEIDTLISEFLPDISLKHVGFPANWKELLKV